ncbi:MAG: dipeptidase [Candidatus Edwardsbacteria bacterium]|nr:dipeptidase [Candidatus Edwardsbacteria bacterium]
MTQTTICDLHCDTAINLADGKGIGGPRAKSQVTLEKLKAGGVGLQVYACWVSPKYRHRLAWDRARQLIAAVKKEISEHRNEMMLVTGKQSWQECRKSKRIGVLLAVEGGHVLDGDISRLDSLYDQGVRILTLTWNNSNIFACSAYSLHKTGVDKGLTPTGRQLIARADKLGMHIDLSHSSEKTFWDVLKTSKHPPLLSHSCANFLNGHFRNASDRQIKAVSDRKGLMGINFCPAFLGDEHKPKSVESVADQFEYVKELAGTDILAIGSDFDGIRETPEGLDGPDKLPGLLGALKERGFSKKEIEDIGLYNTLRYFGWQ